MSPLSAYALIMVLYSLISIVIVVAVCYACKMRKSGLFSGIHYKLRLARIPSGSSPQIDKSSDVPDSPTGLRTITMVADE